MKRRRPVRVALVSLGCAKNVVDSERMLAVCAEGGCLVPAPLDEADVIVVNTCGFLQAAREESIEAIGAAVARKRAGPTRRVVVAGCLASRDGEDLYRSAPGIDAVVGVNDRDAILSAVTARRRVTRLSPCRGGIHGDSGRFRITPRHTAYLRIAEGCSRSCTFCTIPAIRGPFRSKAPQDVLAEARELIADGTFELNVIAQDTTSYGADLAGRGRAGWTLARLLRELDALPGAGWIRLLYGYPRRFTDGLIGALAECARVVEYVDLPLQHVADGVLKRMGRRVTRRRIEALLAQLRRRIHGIAIRTTFIAGFPGETDRDFEELLAFVRDFRFDAVGVFAFSPEPGTPAADLPGQVQPELRAQRAERLMLAQQAVCFAANSRAVGRRLDVLVDGADADGRCVGRHRGQAPEVDSACILTRPAEAGGIVPAVVVDRQDYDLIVEPLG